MHENGEDSSSPSKEKVWERSWTTDEMRNNASSWTLAGDSGLLKHLQEFSQTVLARTSATEKALDLLVEEINTAASSINTTNNKFLCLSNTQFVENRVYDDDEKETPQDAPIVDKKTKEETDAEMLKRVREALSMSVAVLDTMFEPIEIQASDSEVESEDDKQCTKTLLLEPHNPYLHRPLPHLIGSDAFMSDDHIGLGDSPSDSEDQPIKNDVDYDMEGSSESDIDFSATVASKRNRDVYSSQSSSSDKISFSGDFGTRSKKVKPVDTSEDLQAEQSSGSSSQLPPGNLFAAQLAAKLGNISSATADSKFVNEKGSIESKATSGNLFGGPVSDDEDDALFAKGSGFFSDGPKLFDDLEDTNNSLWGSVSQETSKILASDEKKDKPVSGMKSKAQISAGDLFSQNISDEEDDLFSTKPKNPAKTIAAVTQNNLGTEPEPSQLPHVTGLNYGIITSTPGRVNDEVKSSLKAATDSRGLPFDGNSSNLIKDVPTSSAVAGSEEPLSRPALKKEALSAEDKKPTGGVAVLQSNVLAGLKAKLPRRPSSSESESSIANTPDNNPNSFSKSQPSNSNENAEIASTNSVGGFSRRLPSQSALSSPALTSTRLSNDDGYQTKNLSHPISSIPFIYDGDSDGDDLFSRKPSSLTSQKSNKVSGGLFAEDVNDKEDGLFAVGSSATGKGATHPSTLSESVSHSSPLKVEGCKPETLSSILDEEKLTHQVLPKMSSGPSASISSSKISVEKSFDQARHNLYSTVPPPLKSESKVKKTVSLFDDSDSGEDEFLFSSASSAGSRRSQASSDILAASSSSISEKKPLFKKGLFDDDDALFSNIRNDPDIDIFSGSSKESPKPGAVLEPSQIPAKAGSVEKDNTQQITAITSSDTNSKAPIKADKSNTDLFQDELFVDTDNEDDLFSSNPKAEKEKIMAQPVSKNDENNSSLEKMEDVIRQSLKLPESSSEISRTSKTSLVVENDGPENKEVNASEGTLNSESKPPEVKKFQKVGSGSLHPSNNNATQDSLQKPPKPEPPKTLNIRKETDPGVGFLDASDDEEDLFSSSSKKMEPPKLPVKPILSSKLVGSSVPKSFINKPDDSQLMNSTTNKPPEVETSESSEVDGTPVNTLKIRDSLFAGRSGLPSVKIDPRTLLPGSRPPPRFTPPKDENSGPLPAVANTESSKGPLLDHPIGFDQPVLNNAILPSANKTRAKLGVKRRPPSNKARREAARASQNYDESDKESPLSPDLPSPVNRNPVGADIPSSNTVLSPSTDEDDLFGVPQDLPPEYGNQNLSAVDIFGAAPIISPIIPKNSRNELFSGNKEKDLLCKENEESSGTYSVPKESLFLSSEDSFKSSEDSMLTQPPSSSTGSVNFQINASLISEKMEPLEASIMSKKVEGRTELDKTSILRPGNIDQSSKSNPSVRNSTTVAPPTIPEDSKLQKEMPEMETTVPETEKRLATSIEGIEHESSTVDPLNKAGILSTNDEDEFCGSTVVVGETEDHSSLFPFVKKKQSSNRPLFSETPTLPSKGEKSLPKVGLGALDDQEENDLFPAASKSVLRKKTETSKSKDVKVWDFSNDDDNDEDLFLSGAKKVSSNNTPSKSASTINTSEPIDVLKKSPLKNSIERKPKASPPAAGAKNGLFSDDDNNDNNDLFSKPSLLTRQKTKEAAPMKSSLFGDDDDDDDLFGSSNFSSKTSSYQAGPKDSSQATTKTPAASKSEREFAFHDPLMAQQKDN